MKEANETQTDFWRITWCLERANPGATTVETVKRMDSTALRCDKIDDANFVLWRMLDAELQGLIEAESQSDLAKRHHEIDNPTPTIKSAPRIYVGKTIVADGGTWFITEDKSTGTKKWEHSKKSMLMWGDIFVPGTHCKPDDSWREMESIETCSEVDW